MIDKLENSPKREIDRLRESAGSMNINVPGDDSEITGMLTLDDRLLIVKRKGIYEVKMADQIDPERTNPDVPNTVQRLTPYGSDEVFVGKVLLTGYGLLKKDHLVSRVDADAAMVLVAEVVKNIAEMRALSDRFDSEERESVATFEARIESDRSLMLPCMTNVDIRIREFIQKADHSLQKLFEVTKLFYTKLSKGGWEALKGVVENETKIDNFDQFLDEVLPLLLMTRNARNSVEHERADMKLKAIDFSINAENQLNRPTVELLHPKTPFEPTPINEFMVSICAQIADIAELLLVFLCARHVDSSGNLPIGIIEIPPDRRSNPNVRYSFGMMIGDQLVPFS